MDSARGVGVYSSVILRYRDNEYRIGSFTGFTENQLLLIEGASYRTSACGRCCVHSAHCSVDIPSHLCSSENATVLVTKE